MDETPIARLPQPPKNINPLWIISLFFSFTEIALGVVAFKTTGNVQVALTCFVVGFPLLIAAGFFALLWYRPEHLYAPKDFGSDESFLKSIAEARRARVGLLNFNMEIENSVNKSLTSDQLVQKLSSLDSDELREALRATAADISHNIIEATTFTVSFSDIFPDEQSFTVSYLVDAFKDFSDLLGRIYISLGNLVEPYTYGTSWVLKDIETGQIFKNARMITGLKPGKPLRDSRTLDEVGIKAGMHLEVITLEK